MCVAFVAFLPKELFIAINGVLTHKASLEFSKRAKIPLLTLVSWVLNSHGPHVQKIALLWGIFFVWRMRAKYLHILSVRFEDPELVILN